MDKKKLVEKAMAARERAYAPYSHFQVGAALLTESGEIFLGCNVENAAYGLTMCAERVAVFKAVCAGHRRFQAIALASNDGASPCGSCRQVLREFGDDILVIVADLDGNWQSFSIQALLPASFTSQNLND
jgi:cytidine deaminase